jgi:hypothetical protein
MEPEHYRFGGGSSGTLLHPLVAVAMVLAVILILRLPRKQVVSPLLFGIFLIPRGQVIVLAGLHFNVYRIILLAGLLRWIISRRKSKMVGGFNAVDRVFALWATALLVVFNLQYMETQALVKSMGDFLDAMSGYFILRFLIRDKEDVRLVIKVFALIAVIMGVCMINEQRTGQDIFGQLGGTALFPETRNGKIR